MDLIKGRVTASKGGKVKMRELKKTLARLLMLKSGNKSGIKISDVELFEMIEDFAWRYAPQKIAGLDLHQSLLAMGNSLSEFFPPQRQCVKNHRQHRDGSILSFKTYNDSYYDLETISENVVYEIESTCLTLLFKPFKGHRESRGSKTYMAVSATNNDLFDIVIWFRKDGKAFINYGLHIKNRNCLLMRNLETGEPNFLYLGHNTDPTCEKLSTKTPVNLYERLATEIGLGEKEAVDAENKIELKIRKYLDTDLDDLIEKSSGIFKSLCF